MVTVTKQKQFVGYIRVSTERQIGDGHASLETQESRIREHASASGGVILQIFRDVQSGRRNDRPEYRRMLEFSRDAGIDGVIVQYLDRFGRNPKEILQRFWQLQESGISVEATDQDIRDELLLMISAGLAGHESRRISERVRANMGNIIRSGTHSGKRPFGFRPVKEIVDGRARTVEWVINDPEAEVIREMYRLSVDENLGYKAIADSLNSRGMVRDSGSWVPSSIQVILRNPVLKGLMLYGRRPKKGNPKSEPIEVPGVFPQILTDEEWDALQIRLDIRSKASRGSTHKSEYLLSGILKCGHCGGPMSGKSGSAHKGRRYRSYVCTQAVRTRAKCSFYNGHSTRKIEPAFLEYLGQFSDPKKVAELLATSDKKEQARNRKEMKKLGRKLESLDRDFQQNLEILKKGLISDEEFALANKSRRDDRAKTESRLAELRQQIELAEVTTDRATTLPERIDSFVVSFDSLEVRKAKAILQTIVESAHVSTDGTIELKFR